MMWLVRFAGRELLRLLLAAYRAVRTDWWLIGEMYDQIKRERARHG